MTLPPVQPHVLDCGGDAMLAMFHPCASDSGTGVVIVVGGPQYRVGSHRQFLQLARSLQAAGIPTLRFDYRGMGDSDGPYRGFEDIDDDIRVAIDCLFAQVPGLKGVVLWGLCDGASAILFYARTDPRVSGIVLLNPWVRTEAGLARTHLRHHYLGRLFERNFWVRLLTGEVNPLRAVSGLLATLTNALRRRDGSSHSGTDLPLPERMAAGFRAYTKPILLIISGQDLTAKEFEDVSRGAASWDGISDPARVARHELPDADHTFSRKAWRNKVAQWTVDWVRGIEG